MSKRLESERALLEFYFCPFLILEFYADYNDLKSLDIKR